MSQNEAQDFFFITLDHFLQSEEDVMKALKETLEIYRYVYEIRKEQS